jgi:hypothetical protein
MSPTANDRFPPITVISGPLGSFGCRAGRPRKPATKMGVQCEVNRLELLGKLSLGLVVVSGLAMGVFQLLISHSR